MIGLLWCIVAAVLGAGVARSDRTASNTPSILFILLDDQDAQLIDYVGEERGVDFWKTVFPNMAARIRDEGAEFRQGHVSTPICCPSRTISVTGRYSHNNGYTNTGEGQCMHVYARRGVYSNTSVFQRSHAAGIATWMSGKLTNDQPGYLCPKGKVGDMSGFTGMGGACDDPDYMGTEWVVKDPATGKAHIAHLSADEMTTYQTTQIGNRTQSFLEWAIAENKPFFAWVGPHAPHYPAMPAPWAEHDFDNETAPRPPSYNLSTTDHHLMVSNDPPITDVQASFIDQHWRDRLGAAKAADDMVNHLLDTLQNASRLDSTFVVFSSDHGYHLGELNVPCSKEQPYQSDMRIPTWIRGPGVKAGVKVDALVSNVDYTPTFMDLFSIPFAADDYDGKSLMSMLVTEENPYVPVVAQSDGWRDALLVEYFSVGSYYADHCRMFNATPGNWEGEQVKAPSKNPEGVLWFVDSTHSNTWRSLRIKNSTHDLIYTEFEPNFKFNTTNLQFVELFDQTKDPWSTKNLAPTASQSLLDALHDQIEAYGSCRGADCP